MMDGLRVEMESSLTCPEFINDLLHIFFPNQINNKHLGNTEQKKK